MRGFLTRRLMAEVFLGLFLFGLVLSNLAAPQTARAAGYTASDFGDLVAAINAANTNPGDDTITLTADITLPAALPSITSNITFEGGHSISGANLFQIFEITSGNVTIDGLTFRDGFALSGGAIVNVSGNLRINNSTFTNNHASGDNNAGSGNLGFGGAIYNSTGNIEVTNSTFSDNLVSANGLLFGGLAEGGAIASSGFMTVTNSTFTDNKAAARGVTLGDGTAAGGAIVGFGLSTKIEGSTFISNQAIAHNGTFGGALALYSAKITINNSTFYNNQVNADGTGNGTGKGGFANGGAIYSAKGATISNSTLVGNSTTATGTPSGTRAGESIYSSSVGDFLFATIITTNSGAPNCSNTQPVIDMGSNLQYPDNSCGATIPVADPQLDPLGAKNNGGPTETIALLKGSPAIDQIPVADCPPTDQRGFPRVGLCDIGAYEAAKASAAAQPPPADLVGQLRLTPDRVVANDPENLIRYTFTVKNIGQGEAGSVSLKLPVDEHLVIGFTEFTTPGVWVSSLSDEAVTVSLPELASNAEVSGTIIFRPNAVTKPPAGTNESRRFTLVWTNPNGDSKEVWSNEVSYTFGEAGTNQDASGGVIQLMNADSPDGSKVTYYADFCIPDETVSAWLTGPDGKSVALSQGLADDQGHYAITVDTKGLAAGTYVVAAYGQRSQTYGSGILEVSSSGSSQAKPAGNLNLKALGDKQGR